MEANVDIDIGSPFPGADSLLRKAAAAQTRDQINGLQWTRVVDLAMPVDARRTLAAVVAGRDQDCARWMFLRSAPRARMGLCRLERWMLPSAAWPAGFGSVGEAARDGDFMAAFDVDVDERANSEPVAPRGFNCLFQRANLIRRPVSVRGEFSV
jgi:hypothetical protein